MIFMSITQLLERLKFEAIIICEGRDDKEVIEFVCGSLRLLREVRTYLAFSRGRYGIPDYVATLRGYVRYAKTLMLVADAGEKSPKEQIENLRNELISRGLRVSIPLEDTQAMTKPPRLSKGSAK